MKRPFKSRPIKKSSSSRSDVDRIFGVHAVRAALANPGRTIRSLFVTKNGFERISDIVEKAGCPVVEVSAVDLSRRLDSNSVHQGMLVEAAPLPSIDLETVLARQESTKPLILLDQVTDPHNVGAILRSAAAFNAAAIIMTRRNSPPLDGVLAKSASGAVEHVPVVMVTNLARALEDLRQFDVQTIGLDGDAKISLETIQLQWPCALVLGAEGKGLRRLTAENCDILCRLTTTGPLSSLNVSNAAAVALHTLAMRVK